MHLKYKSIITVVLLSIFTCGIYAIYYEITTQDDIRATYHKEALPSGLTVFLLSIVTCGIYTIYWMYKTSIIVNEISMDCGMRTSDDTVLLVLLGVFITPIAYYALLQNKINTLITYNSQSGMNSYQQR